MNVSGSSSIFGVGTGTITDFSAASVVDFETVTGAGTYVGKTIDFDLTGIVTNGATDLGNCGSNAANVVCTPANSPFTYAENSSGTAVTISFTLLLNAYTGSSAGGVTAYQGTFSSQFAGTLSGIGGCASSFTADITNMVACENAGGTIAGTWLGTESPLPSSTTSTPEPMSIALLGSVMLIVMPYLRHSRRA